MRDYEELIARLRALCPHEIHTEDLDEAANAIETLSAQLTASEVARADLAKRWAMAQQECDVVHKAQIALMQELAQVKAERNALENDVRKFCRDWWENDSRFPCHFCKHENGELCNAKMSDDGCCYGSHFEWRGTKETT